MAFLLALIPGKTKLYALAAMAFVIGLLGWRRAGIKAALEREQKKQLERRIDAIAIKNNAALEAETQDDETMIERLTKRSK